MNACLLNSIRVAALAMLLLVCGADLATAQYETYYKPFYNHAILPLPDLRIRLAKTAPDTTRVRYLLAIADSFLARPGSIPQDIDSVERYLKKADALAHSLGSEKWKHNTLMEYGQYYQERAMPEAQLEVYRRAIILSQKSRNKELEADAWFYYSNNFYFEDSEQQSRVQAAANAIATSLNRESNNALKAAFRLKLLADFHLVHGQYDLAETEMLEVIAIYRSYNYKYIYYSYDLMSAIYNHKGDLSKALYYALCTLKACENQYKKPEGIFLRRLAEAYAALGKRDESIKWYTRSFNHYAERNDGIIWQMVLSELTSELIYDNQASKALELINKTKKRFPKSDEYADFWFAMAYGDVYTALGKFDLAAPYIKISLAELANEVNNDELNTRVYYAAGGFYFAQKKYDQAHYYLQKAADKKIRANLPLLIRLYKKLYEIDMIKNRPAAAIINLQYYHKLQDSVFTQEKINTVERLQIEFNAAQKENENELLRKKSELQSQQLERDLLIKRSTFGGLGFLSLLVILLYSRFNLKKRVNGILVEQKKTIAIAYEKLEVSVQQKNKLIQDKERLIKEVHHRVNNNLQLTMSLLNSQSYYLEDQSAITAIRESQHRIKSIALVHQKLYQSDNVATVNINPYVAELVDYLRNSLGGDRYINFEMQLADLEMDIGQAVPLGLFLNEAITNIIKYAFPGSAKGKVEIGLSAQQGNFYLLKIKDNGIGLPAGANEGKSNTLGMTLMKGLSSQMDAELLMENDNGLTISLIFENRQTDSLTLND